MRTIERSGQFKDDFKKLKKQPRHRRDIDALLSEVLLMLANDEPIPAKYLDHPLSGDWANYRDLHIKPDLLLIYRKSGDDILRLARIGSHSNLFK